MQRSGWEYKILKYVLALESSISASFLRVKLEGQFAMAVRIPQEQCVNGGFTLTEYYKDIKKSIGERFTKTIYSAGLRTQIIAARPHGLHAELRVLQALRKQTVNTNDCIVLYSLYSPCLECIKVHGDKNIIDELIFGNLPRSQTAFVFDVVYNPSKSLQSKPKPTKAQVSEGFDHISIFTNLYYCKKDECEWCGRNNVNENPCLDDY